jgi:hypothetical protein
MPYADMAFHFKFNPSCLHLSTLLATEKGELEEGRAKRYPIFGLLVCLFP